MRNLKYLLAATLALSFTAILRGEEWPKWRGPNGDGISRETGLLTEWPAEGPAKVWTVPVASGFASPVAVDGTLYLFTFTAADDKSQEILQAIDALTGKQLWSQSYPGGYTSMNESWMGARATPAIDGGRIYTFGGSGDLVCRERADGKEVWHINILKMTKADNLNWGLASSPLIVGDAVIVQNGRGKGVPVAVAFNKNDGKVIWESESKGSSEGAAAGIGAGTGGGYAAPILASVGGSKQVIVLGGVAIYALDPASGKQIWKQEWRTEYDVNATTPIYQEPNLFVSNGYKPANCALFELTPTGAKEIWKKTDVMGSRFPGVVLDRGYLYGNSEGILRCVSWKDGSVAWEVGKSVAADRLGPGGSLVRFGDYLITLSEGGKLTLAKATPEKYEKVVAVKGLVKSTLSNDWATPLIYRGKLYIRGVDELVCLDISAK